MNKIRVQTEAFDVSTECGALARNCANTGAIVTFTGRVRSDDGVTAMTLEHYPGMTESEIAKCVAEAQTRWSILGATIIHRAGRLLPGEEIVLVAVASAHREAAFRTAEFLMDYLKTRAPFWKLEERGAETAWIDARESDVDAALRWRNP
jgi:molybdopterin synthase catalytic subunit